MFHVPAIDLFRCTPVDHLPGVGIGILRTAKVTLSRMWSAWNIFSILFCALSASFHPIVAADALSDLWCYKTSAVDRNS